MNLQLTIARLVLLCLACPLAPLSAQNRLLPLGDSITAGAQGGPYSDIHDRGGYRYYLERYLEGSEGGAAGFSFTGSVNQSAGTIVSYAGPWFPGNVAKPLNHPLHSGYSGSMIAGITSRVLDNTIPVAASDVIFLQIGTNDMVPTPATPVPASPADIGSWIDDYVSLLNAILVKNPTVKVVMAKIPPVTSGWVYGNIATNAARIEPFNSQVVEPVYQVFSAAHPGRFLLVDNYAPLDPLNVEDSYDTATNDTDFLTVIGDGIHPYNAGHRKFAVNFWKARQLAKGKAAAELITPHDGGGDDACIRESGNVPDGLDVERQPFVRSSANATERGKYYLKLDLSGKPKHWEDARFNLVFWGGPSVSANFGNCVNDAPAAATLKLYGIPDGADDWNGAGITWANAPGNGAGENSVSGTFLGELIIPQGAQTGDVTSVSSPALRDFVNHQRGLDGMLTFAVTGDGTNPGYFPSFQDSDFRDYASSFLQLTRTTALPTAADLRILTHGFDLAAAPLPKVAVTFSSDSSRTYLLSGSTDLQRFDLVLAAGIEGAAASASTTVLADLPANPGSRFFIRIEQE